VLLANDILGLGFDLLPTSRANSTQLALRLGWMAFAVTATVVSLGT
jgi:hypothetical protein